MRTESIAIGRITVADRNRHDLGDIQSLADSISRIGLLHPIGVTEDHRLIFGQRRLAACTALGMTEIRASIVSNLSEAGDLLIAERDENTCRKPMLPSELYRLGSALAELERPKARERMLEAAARGGRAEGSGPGATALPRVRDIVGPALGMSGRTWERIESVFDEAETGNPIAIDLTDKLDAGDITPREADDLLKAAKPAEPKPTRVQKVGRHIPLQEVLDRSIRELSIASDVFDGIDTSCVLATQEQIRTIQRAISTLRRVKRELTGGNDA